MAYTLNTNHSAVATVAQAISTAFMSVATSFGAMLVHVAHANSRSDQVEYMNNLTDVELATKYGIDRTGIVAYIFRDKMS